MLTCASALACSLLSLHALGAPVDGPDKARTVAVRTPNVTDGFPDAEAWEAARSARPFLVAGDTGRQRTNEAGFLYDDRALYVRVCVNDPSIGQHSPTREGQPGSRGVWSNDCVELFLGAPTDPSAKVHLAVDLLGQRYQSPAIQWQSRAERDAKGYTVWFAVPFASLEWGEHQRGDVWRLKVAHESKTGLGNSMWPVNFSPAFNAEKAWGLLYFETDNLMPDGEFEELAGQAKRKSWRLTGGDRSTGDIGAMAVVPSPLPGGGSAVRLNKTKAEPAWYPYLMSTRHLALRKGRSYVVSAWVRTDQPWVFRCYFHKKGVAKYIKALRVKQKPSPGKMRRFEVPFVMPDDADTFYPGMRFAQAQTGAMLVDRVALRLDPLADSHVGAREGEPHPIHNLLELARRGRILPDHLRRKGLTEFPCERVVFKDTATGATLWKLTRWPGYSRHQYANMLCWNANASLLKILSSRARNLLMSADGGRMVKLPVPDADWVDRWCPVRPERLYAAEYRDDKKVYYVYDVRTHKKRYLPGVYPRQGTSMWVPHPDGKRLLVVENSQSRSAKTSFGHVIDPDTGQSTTFDFQGTTHQVWFTKRPDYLIYFGYESTNKHYDHEQREGAWLIRPDGTGLRRVYRPKWVHRDFSPDGRRVAFHNVGLVIVNVADGGDEKQVSTHSGGHATWQVTPDWFVSSTGGVLRCVGARGQGFDYVLCHSLFQSPFENFSGRERPCSSPDGTKVAYSSSMLGDFDFYNVVSRLPLPPRQVKASVKGSTVRLRWSAPERHKETKGYFVYRAAASGGDYRQLNAQPVAQPAYTDTLPAGATHAFYIVTAIEHSGLEGRPSVEVCASPTGAWRGAVRRYVEIEDARTAQPLMECFDAHASSLYVLRMDRAGAGKATLAVDAPKAGAYAVWLRARSVGGAGKATVLCAGRRLAPVAVDAQAYRWLKLGRLDLPAGASELALDVRGKRVRVDALFLTDDLETPPRDNLLWDAAPPGAPARLRAERVGDSDVQLAWDAPPDMDVAHYNVYAGAKSGFKPSQQHLVASPLETYYTDWGLHRGRAYHYKVCAVDRRGNESAPSQELAVRTAGAAGVVLLRRPVGQARDGLPAKGARARTRLEQMGAFAERAHRLAKATPLHMRFDVPTAGRYVVWVKYGIAEQKGAAAIRVAANGERAAVGWALRFVGSGYLSSLKHNVGAFVWEPCQTGVGRYNRTHVFDLKPGPLEVTLQVASDSRFEVAELVLTNDFGHQPAGIHCYRPGNPTWLAE